MRYIDADKFEEILIHSTQPRHLMRHPRDVDIAVNILNSCSSADVVEVVRCKDCKLFRLDRNIVPDLGTCEFVEMVRNIRDYCSKAERKAEQAIKNKTSDNEVKND